MYDKLLDVWDTPDKTCKVVLKERNVTHTHTQSRDSSLDCVRCGDALGWHLKTRALSSILSIKIIAEQETQDLGSISGKVLCD